MLDHDFMGRITHYEVDFAADKFTISWDDAAIVGTIDIAVDDIGIDCILSHCSPWTDSLLFGYSFLFAGVRGDQG